MAKIEVYTQDWCPFCARALALFASKGVKVTEIPAPHGSAEREAARARSGGRTTMPQIFIDDRHIGGCDDLLALDRSGGLAPLIGAGTQR